MSYLWLAVRKKFLDGTIGISSIDVSWPNFLNDEI